jgi:CheY-like chemotaxis protein
MDSAMNKTSYPKRVLVIEDNIDAADSLVQLLQIFGHQALAVYTAREAFNLLNTYQADIVLLDIGLPDMSGYEVARQIRQANQEIVLVALTGYIPDVNLAHAAGFNKQVTKPIMLDTLEELLHTRVA